MESTHEKIIEQIEEYINGTMTAEQVEVFEQKILLDPKLKTEIEKHNILHSILSDTDSLAFKKKLIAISEDIKAEDEPITLPKNTRNSLMSYWKIAASVVVVIGLGSLLWLNFTASGNETNLFQAYYTPYPIEDVTRGTSKNVVEEVMESYAKGEYNIAIPNLEALLQSSYREQLRLYLGNSYLNTNQEQKAIFQFKSISNSSKYYEDARWYMALAYLKLQEFNESKQILQEVIKYNGIYKNKAIILKEKLNDK